MYNKLTNRVRALKSTSGLLLWLRAHVQFYDVTSCNKNDLLCVTDCDRTEGRNRGDLQERG